MTNRCEWALNDTLSMQYHDQEWGLPEHDERKLFEAMTLEIFQAGLSWQTILKKRAALNSAFANFDSRLVSQYDEEQFNKLMNDATIIRNRAKIEATINNASVIEKLHANHQTLSNILWTKTNNQPLNHLREQDDDLNVSQFVAPYLKTFKTLGFKRLGPTTMYSFLQAVGVVNDHELNCVRYKQILNFY
ncbi:DNA-3-methyladenine glycosylase I [Lactobacillaceae bacterium Scapto_B20]